MRNWGINPYVETSVVGVGKKRDFWWKSASWYSAEAPIRYVHKIH